MTRTKQCDSDGALLSLCSHLVTQTLQYNGDGALLSLGSHLVTRLMQCNSDGSLLSLCSYLVIRTMQCNSDGALPSGERGGGLALPPSGVPTAPARVQGIAGARDAAPGVRRCGTEAMEA